MKNHQLYVFVENISQTEYDEPVLLVLIPGAAAGIYSLDGWNTESDVGALTFSSVPFLIISFIM